MDDMDVLGLIDEIDEVIRDVSSYNMPVWATLLQAKAIAVVGLQICRIGRLLEGEATPPPNPSRPAPWYERVEGGQWGV